jgi:tetrahydromethanopterin S-methyltransferase subunit C
MVDGASVVSSLGMVGMLSTVGMISSIAGVVTVGEVAAVVGVVVGAVVGSMLSFLPHPVRTDDARAMVKTANISFFMMCLLSYCRNYYFTDFAK